jgi:hypothetical protein
VPATVLGASDFVQFAADPIGATDWIYAPEMMVHPGQRAIWRIGNAPSLSMAYVR